jgi:RP/EB family microtubule-associated protein
MTESIGMMEGAFFVGKKDILNWVNETFKLKLTDIVQASNGALYCQILDSVHPGKVKLQKVNWQAKNDYDIMGNYKILQQGMLECKVNKYLEVEKLSKGRTQENLEMLQWLKKYYEVNRPSGEYDAEKRRGGAELQSKTNMPSSKARDNSKNRDLVVFSKKANISKEKSVKNLLGSKGSKPMAKFTTEKENIKPQSHSLERKNEGISPSCKYSF